MAAHSQRLLEMMPTLSPEMIPVELVGGGGEKETRHACGE